MGQTNDSSGKLVRLAVKFDNKKVTPISAYRQVVRNRIDKVFVPIDNEIWSDDFFYLLDISNIPYRVAPILSPVKGILFYITPQKPCPYPIMVNEAKEFTQDSLISIEKRYGSIVIVGEVITPDDVDAWMKIIPKSSDKRIIEVTNNSAADDRAGKCWWRARPNSHKGGDNA